MQQVGIIREFHFVFQAHFIFAVEEIVEETLKDEELKAPAKVIKFKRWHDIPEQLEKFNLHRERLTFTTLGVVLHQNKIVLSAALREKAMKMAHSGHLGMGKTKKLHRSKTWFPGFDHMVEDMVKCSSDIAFF